MEATESAIVVLVPEAETIVAEWRRELDPAALMGVPAHITVMWPFVPPREINYDVIARCAAALRHFSTFEFRLTEVRWFGEAAAWITPDPPEPFVSVTRALLDEFPDYPRYGGTRGDEIVPHLTIADGGPLERMRLAAREVTRRLPITVQTRDIAITARSAEPHSWAVLRRVPLAEANG